MQQEKRDGGLSVSAYNGWLGASARQYRQSQIKAATAVNVEMLKFYWALGADVARLERHQPWGSKFMHRVSEDLKCWMPGAKCFSRVNLYYMVRFFKLYAPAAIVQQLAEQIESGGGLIVCREKDRVTVQYALASSALPIGVSDYVLERFIPVGFKSQLPTIEEVEQALTRRLEIQELRGGAAVAAKATSSHVAPSP